MPIFDCPFSIERTEDRPAKIGIRLYHAKLHLTSFEFPVSSFETAVFLEPVKLDTLYGCATNLWVSILLVGRTTVPEFFPATTELVATQRDDGIGTADRPVHAGQLEALAENGLAARLNHTRSHE